MCLSLIGEIRKTSYQKPPRQQRQKPDRPQAQSFIKVVNKRYHYYEDLCMSTRFFYFQ